MSKDLKDTYYVSFFSRYNLGDDLFIRILLERYRNTSFYINERRDYREQLSPYKNVIVKKRSSVDITKNMLLRKLGRYDKLSQNKDADRCKGIINIGGSLYVEPDKPWLDTRNPVYVLGANFGPYKTKEYKELYEDYFRGVKDICFRDKESYELFKDLGNVRMAPDIVFSLGGACDGGRYGLFVSVMDLYEKSGYEPEEIQSYEALIIKEARRCIREKKIVVLSSFFKIQGDENAVNRIYDSFTAEEQKYVRKLFYHGRKNETEKLLKVIKSSEAVLGTRYHSIVLGLAFGKNVAALCYNNKSYNLMTELGFAEKAVIIKPELMLTEINEEKCESMKKLLGEKTPEAYLEKEVPYVSLTQERIKQLKTEAAGHFRELDKILN